MNNQQKNDFINFIINNCFNPEDAEKVKNIILNFFNMFENNGTIEINGHSETFKMIIRFIEDLIISVQELTPEQSLEEIKPLEINKCIVDGIKYIKYYSFTEDEPYKFKIENGKDEYLTDNELAALNDNHPTWSTAIFPAPPNSPQLRF